MSSSRCPRVHAVLSTAAGLERTDFAVWDAVQDGIVKLRALGRLGSRLLRNHYPPFLFGVPRLGDRIPAFCYHDVEPAAFRSDLEFLARNGYRCLGTAEFVDREGRNRGDRCVLLTFDDARRSFWTAALPLLDEFDARATLFVPTLRIDEAAAAAGHGHEAALMTWAEIARCARSRVVDVQSHSHRHALVYTGAEPVDFASPALRRRYDAFDWPIRRSETGDVLGVPPLGTPLYRAVPLLSASRRVIEPEGVVRECQRLVAERGGSAFFSRPGWRTELRRVHSAAMCEGSRGGVIDGAAFRALVDSEFELSSRAFKEELGYVPTFFAYPWELGSRHSLEAAAHAGIRAAFGVGIDVRTAGRRARRAGLKGFGRMQSHWLRFLPGRGRESWMRILPRRVRALAQPQHSR